MSAPPRMTQKHCNSSTLPVGLCQHPPRLAYLRGCACSLLDDVDGHGAVRAVAVRDLGLRVAQGRDAAVAARAAVADRAVVLGVVVDVLVHVVGRAERCVAPWCKRSGLV